MRSGSASRPAENSSSSTWNWDTITVVPMIFQSLPDARGAAEDSGIVGVAQARDDVTDRRGHRRGESAPREHEREPGA